MSILRSAGAVLGFYAPGAVAEVGRRLVGVAPGWQTRGSGRLLGGKGFCMAGYTLVNLRDVEDMAPKFGFAPNVEARFARVPLELEQSGVSYFRIAPGFRMPFGHRHETQEEVYLVLSGSARMKLDDAVVELGAMDAVRVAPDTTRGMEAGADGAEIIAFGAPTQDNRDAQLVPEWWTD
jgi:mannose-6-phosphate isomerase-like protein (cupin superfamily)